MSVRSIAVLLLFGTVLGCGKSADQNDQTVVEVGTPSASMNNDSTADNASQTAPGLIEMPSGIDANSAPAIPPASDQKSGGIEMPPIGTNGPPVVARRPVLDDPVPAAEITLTAGTLESILQRVAEAGNVCVVDVWSLSCEPCLKEFPNLVRLNQELAGKITCMSVNVDYIGRKTKPAETYRTQVTSFLQSTGATCENFLCETPSEDVYASLKIASIPAVLIYDRNGKLIRTFSDVGDDRGFNYAEDVAPLVRSLLTQ